MIKKKKKFFSAGQEGFGLIEIALTLIIVGVLISGGVIQSLKYLEIARLQKTEAQIKEYAHAISSFAEIYGSPPGKYNDANKILNVTVEKSEKKSGAASQNVSSRDALFWEHLYAAGLIKKPDQQEKGISYPSTPFGGGYTITKREGDPCLELSDKGRPLFTRYQANAIKKALSSFCEVVTFCGNEEISTKKQRASSKACTVLIFLPGL